MHLFFLSPPPPPPPLFSFLSACVTHDLLVTVCLPVCGVCGCGCVCMHVQISTWISLFIEVLSTVEHHLRTIKLRATFTFYFKKNKRSCMILKLQYTALPVPVARETSHSQHLEWRHPTDPLHQYVSLSV